MNDSILPAQKLNAQPISHPTAAAPRHPNQNQNSTMEIVELLQRSAFTMLEMR